MNKFHRFQNFRQLSSLFSQIWLKKRHTSLFAGICREIWTKFHQKFEEKSFSSFFSFFLFLFWEQRAPRERAPSSERWICPPANDADESNDENEEENEDNEDIDGEDDDYADENTELKNRKHA